MKKILSSLFFTSLLMLSGCGDKPCENCGALPPILNDNTYSPSKVRFILDSQQRKMIDYFVSGADKISGMCLNSSQWSGTMTTGATGMGFMNIIAGVERGWISREEGLEQILKVVKFLDKADRYHGAWSHWYGSDGKSITFGNQKSAGEIVETAFVMTGLIAAKEYFAGFEEKEIELRRYVDKFWNEIEWSNYVCDDKLFWIWHSDRTGSSAYENALVGWNETLIVYILALAAPEGHNVSPDIYRKCWQSNGGIYRKNQVVYGYSQPLGRPANEEGLFLAQYSFLGLDPRHMADQYVNYWSHVTAYTMINRHYCVYESPKANGYSETDWGITACDGAGPSTGYKGRTPRSDDGVLCPSASISSIPFTPFYSTQVLLNLNLNWSFMNGKYGFKTSYHPASGKASSYYFGMEHAPQAVMIENYRSGLLWSLVMKNEHIKRGLELAGIKEPEYEEGFYLAVEDIKTGVYDMMRHPDREKYEIDYYSKALGKTEVRIVSSEGNLVYKFETELVEGGNVIQFMDNDILRGRDYKIIVTGPEGSQKSINVKLN